MSASFSGSLLPLPSNVTVEPFATLWSATTAVGAWFSTVTVPVSVPERPCGSVTVRLNTRAPSLLGAVKVGLDAVVELSVTVVPLVWLQA